LSLQFLLESKNKYLIDWLNSSSSIILNPAFPRKDRDRINSIVNKLNEKKHVFIATSGSTLNIHEYKLIALSKEAFLNSSVAVNREFQINSKDVLLNVLPIFHVGGLSLFSRAFLAQALILNIWNEKYKWDVNKFVSFCQDRNVTLTSLVPTQVYDIVIAKLMAPKCMRCVFVGGGPLSQQLYYSAIQLGWKLYPSYGMTECCSQVATQSYLSEPQFENDTFVLKILSHVSVQTDLNTRINISGSSLLSYEIFINQTNYQISDPKLDGKYHTQDIGIVRDDQLVMMGRSDDHVKINGELVHLVRLNQKFQNFNFSSHDVKVGYIVCIPNLRTGSELIAVFSEEDVNKTYKIQTHLSHFNKTLLPYERIHKHVVLQKFPKTALGKLKLKALRAYIQSLEL